MNILKQIDKYLNNTPMYRLVLYILVSYTTLALVLSVAGYLSYGPLALLISLLTILVASLATNYLTSKALKLPTQHESTIITSLILFFIIAPVEGISMFYAVVLASLSSILSKYLLTYRNTHIFNPAAAGLFFVSILGFGASYWWIANIYMLPFVIIGGLLLVRKVRKFDLGLYAFGASLLSVAIISLFYGLPATDVFKSVLISGPFFFFISFMVTEPHTLPGTKRDQILYVLFIILFPTLFNLTHIYNLTPEASLLAANILSLLVAGRKRVLLKLENVKEVGQDIFEYTFKNKTEPDQDFQFTPGQYVEINLDHKNHDVRGSRRYFTISSVPGNTFSFTTKFPKEAPSSFKTELMEIDGNATISATQFGGDFILPKDESKPLVFIAGGIGVTPFISFLRSMLAAGTKRDLTLFYCAKEEAEVSFVELLKEATLKLNLKVILVLGVQPEHTNPNNTFQTEYGYLSEQIITKHSTLTNSKEYFISGPNVMVSSICSILHKIGISRRKIHTDFFPGF